MSNWNREKDAWLAEKCEGLRVSKTTAHCAYVYEQLNGRSERVDAYNEDPAACIRAAEAWRLQEKGRRYTTTSPVDYVFGSMPGEAVCFEKHQYIAGVGVNLAQALLQATGWTEPAGGGGE